MNYNINSYDVLQFEAFQNHVTSIYTRRVLLLVFKVINSTYSTMYRRDFDIRLTGLTIDTRNPIQNYSWKFLDAGFNKDELVSLGNKLRDLALLGLALKGIPKNSNGAHRKITLCAS